MSFVPTPLDEQELLNRLRVEYGEGKAADWLLDEITEFCLGDCRTKSWPFGVDVEVIPPSGEFSRNG